MKQVVDPYRFPEAHMPQWETDVRIAQELLVQGNDLSHVEKFMNFPVFSVRQTITRFLVRHELFKMVLDIPGAIFECGVLFGGGLFSFAHFSAIFEPVNAQRRIVGFDTFEGLPALHEKDGGGNAVSSKLRREAMAMDSYEYLEKAIKVFDMNRPLSHLPRVELVKGDVTKTMPKYLSDNPQALVSMIYLDMDIYLGTKAAIEACLPRMPKGAIIAFDEFSCERWPGETRALLDTIGVQGKQLKRFPYDSYVSYLVVD